MPNLWIIMSLLICPLMMGGALWLFMRATRDAPPSIQQGLAQPGSPEPAATQPLPPQPPRAGGMLTIGGICLNWKVLAGLALVGGGVWVLAPSLMGAALPLLLVAACPLSMLFMMRAMQQSRPATPPEPGRLPPATGQTREEVLAALRTEQGGITREIARLEAERVPPAGALEVGPPPGGEPIRARS